LYDIDNNTILKTVFKAEDLAKTLDSAKKWVLKLDVNDDERQKLRGALERRCYGIRCYGTILESARDVDVLRSRLSYTGCLQDGELEVEVHQCPLCM
jgi:hypothetical protein